jgi:multidrug efflux pump subunit AcrA (membrane-fusion protein)
MLNASVLSTRSGALSFLALGFLGFIAPIAAADDLTLLRKMDPVERLAKLAKILKKDQDFAPLKRGPMTLKVPRPGTVESSNPLPVSCRVDARTDDSLFASTILWIIDEESLVKKGDPLVVLDSSYLEAQLQKQKKLVARTEEAFRLTKRHDALVRKDHLLQVRQAEMELDRALRPNPCLTGKEQAAQLERARAALEQAESLASMQLEHSWKYQQRGQAELNRLQVRQCYLEDQIARCVIRAPQDGLVLFTFATQQAKGKGRFAPPKIRFAPGDRVNEGQKLLRVCDLKLLVSVTIPEDRISYVRPGTKAHVLFDQEGVFRRTVSAVVKTVSSTSTRSAFKGDGWQYVTYLELQGDLAGLKPDMKGNVTIVADCLRLPSRSLLDFGDEIHCFVLNGTHLEERIVETGLVDGDFVEIHKGLTEGDLIVSDPREAIARLLQQK